MVTLPDVIRGLTLALNKVAPGVDVTTKDITEEHPRPCFYINVDNMVTEAGSCREDTYDLSISYFAPSQYSGWLDLLKMRETLWKLLHKPIQITKDLWIHPENVEQKPDRSTMWLETSFSVYIIQAWADDEDTTDPYYNGDLMEDLNINMESE